MSGVIAAFARGLDGRAGIEDSPGVLLTGAQANALRWLAHRNGEGVFELNNQVLLAAGERGPFMRSTWSKLERAGLVERYEKRRLRLTEAGRRVRHRLPPGDPDVRALDCDGEEA